VRFERAFSSSSYTQASVTMMATSRYDTARATASLFDVLHEAGCTTLLAFAETPFKILDDSRPNVVRSFDQRAVVPDREPGDLGAFHSYAATRPTSEAIVAEALELLEANRDKRTCTWVYLFDVHQWQQLEDPQVVGSASPQGPERYDNAVAYALKQVSQLLAGVEQLGLAEETVVALSGDHGESLGEKGITGHTRWVYNPFLHVPLIIRAPGVEPRRVADTEVGLIDVMPTLLDLLGAEPALPELDGASLVPLMFGQPLQHAVFAHEESYDAVFGNGYKLVVDRPEGRYRLYDLCDDYAEERSLFGAPDHERVARELYHAYRVSGAPR
jgi:arylsulfatase A-like enzyme